MTPQTNPSFSETAKAVVVVMSCTPWGRHKAVEALTAAHNADVQAAREELLVQLSKMKVSDVENELVKAYKRDAKRRSRERQHSGEDQMNDLKPFTHGQEGTHACCNDRLKVEGAQAQCCFCSPHKGCEINGEDQMTSATPEPELNVEAEAHKIASALIMDTSVAITQEGTRESKRSQMITRAAVKGEAAILALIQQVSDQRVREFAQRLKDDKRTQLSECVTVLYWRQQYVAVPVDVIDQTLSDYLSHKEQS